jgi:hypothetical protein
VAAADRLLDSVADRLVPVGAGAAHGQGYGDILAARRSVVDGAVRMSTVSVGAATAFEVGDSTLRALAEAAESAMNRARAERS